MIADHQKFKKRFRQALKIGNREAQIAATKEELKKQIEDVQSGDFLQILALENLGSASKSHDIYRLGRKHGSKRVGRWAQEFANGFADFIGAYSGIVDIIKGAGGPYGEVAYQTLSILLIVSLSRDAEGARSEIAAGGGQQE